MDKDTEAELQKFAGAVDEVDFTSGFEKQYKKEYRPVPTSPLVIPPPNPSLAWYRDCTTIILVGFLIFILLGGSILLATLVFTVSFAAVCAIVLTYIALGLLFIYAEVKSIHVR